MPFSTTLPGLDESRLDCVRDRMITRMSNLQAAVSGAPLSYTTTVSSGMFLIGDPQSVPPISTHPFWISVVGGSDQDSIDLEVAWRAIPNCFSYSFTTHIYVYIQPDIFPKTSISSETEKRERLRARICDWIRADCFNTTGGTVLTLQSQEFNTGATYDTMSFTVTRIRKGYFNKSFNGDQPVYGAHIELLGELIG